MRRKLEDIRGMITNEKDGIAFAVDVLYQTCNDLADEANAGYLWRDQNYIYWLCDLANTVWDAAKDWLNERTAPMAIDKSER